MVASRGDADLLTVALGAGRHTTGEARRLPRRKAGAGLWT